MTILIHVDDPKFLAYCSQARERTLAAKRRSPRCSSWARSPSGRTPCRSPTWRRRSGIELAEHNKGRFRVKAIGHADQALGAVREGIAVLRQPVIRVRGSASCSRAFREAYVENALQTFPVMAFDEPAARIFASIDAALSAVGNWLAVEDLMIAATALAGGHDVVTRDLRSFSRVPGLKWNRW
jgi:tRNA(fMet)-specific endonuclease VapC